MIKSRLGQFGAILAVTAVLMGCQKESDKPASPSAPRITGPRPNIIFVLVDALRADSLGVYGNTRGLSPTFDDIATQGIIFDRAISQSPWTQPSVASLFCSFNPGAHRVISFTYAYLATHAGHEKVAIFSDQFDTLAESLQKNGYITAGFVANPFILQEFGFAQGFDHFDTTFADNTTPGSVVNNAAISWLQQRDTSKPFFIFLHYMDVHGPYEAGQQYLDPLLDAVERKPDKRKLSPAEFKKLDYLCRIPSKYTNQDRHHRLKVYREYWEARYEAGVREMDHYLDDLRSRLQSLGLWQDAYLILFSDHGEALCEHGLWDHGYSAYHAELHVPLVLRWPGVLPTGKRFPYTVRLIDVMPTLLEQLKLPAVKGIQGASLVKYITGPFTIPRDYAFAEGVKIGSEQKALYSGDLKLMITMDSGQQQLFNITQDAAEQHNLADQDKPMLQAMLTMFQQQLYANKRLAANVKNQYKDLTPEQVQRLRSLGYVK